MSLCDLDGGNLDFLRTYFSKRLEVPDSTLQAIADVSEVIYLKKNSVLQEAEKESHYFYFLMEGVVREYVKRDKGASLNLTFRYAPDTCGFVFLAQIKSSAVCSISAVTDVYVSRISGDDFFSLLQRHPNLLTLLLVENEHHHVQFYKRFEKLIESDITACLLGEGELPLNVVKKIPGYQLASYFGVTPESLSRIKARLKCNNQLAASA